MRLTRSASLERRSWGTSVNTERPTISSAVYPKIRAAARFHVSTVPARLWLMIASSDDSTIAASRRAAGSMVFIRMGTRMAAPYVRKTRSPKLDRSEPVGWDDGRLIGALGVRSEARGFYNRF